MKQLNLSWLTLAACLGLAGCGNPASTNQTVNTNARPAMTATPVSSAPAATPDEFAAARADYSQFCIRCHKPEGTGGIFELEDGTKLKVPSFHHEHAKKDSDKEHTEQIMNGGDGMPAFKNKLEPARIEALVRFIRHEFQGQAAGGPNPASTPSH
jgi:mono/diheme cytochrome c family protein